MLAGQVPVSVVVDRAQECDQCSIILTRVVTLTPPDTSPDLGPGSRVARDSRGAFYVTSGDRKHLLRFDATGRFAGEVGRPGQGPGEFERINAVHAGRADTLFVFDVSGRLNVFNTAGVLVRTRRVPGSVEQAIAQADGTLIVKVTNPSSNGVLQPLVLIGSNGEMRRWFGLSREPGSFANCRDCAERALHTSQRAGRLWLSGKNRYEVESWSTDGKLLGAWRVDESGWFRNWDTQGDWFGGGAPRPSSLMDIVEEENGRLWVLGFHGSPNPRILAPPSGSGIKVGGSFVTGRNRAALEDYMFAMLAQNTETVIDHVDIAKNQVTASARVPGEVRLLDAATAWRTVKLPDDFYAIEILALRVVNASR
jgi:hypothetical protein